MPRVDSRSSLCEGRFFLLLVADLQRLFGCGKKIRKLRSLAQHLLGFFNHKWVKDMRNA
jgi:hypothetical protein